MKATILKRKRVLANIQAICCSSLIVAVLNQSKPIDDPHLLKATIFRMGMIVLAIAGLIIVVLVKRNSPPEPKIEFNSPPLLPDEKALRVTYDSSAEARIRCNIYFTLHQTSIFSVLAFVSLTMALVFSPLYPPYSLQMRYNFIFLFSGIFVGLTAFATAIFLRSLTAIRAPQNTQRVCTSSLTEKGFHDAAPDRTHLTLWSEVTAIKVNRGDIYFWGHSGTGSFIPSSAFSDEEALRKFVQAATTLWKSNGEIWPEEKQ